jgi:hypothetical protein
MTFEEKLQRFLDENAIGEERDDIISALELALMHFKESTDDET